MFLVRKLSFSNYPLHENNTNLPRIDDPCVVIATNSTKWMGKNPYF